MQKLYAIVDYPDPYVLPLILNAIKSELKDLDVKLIPSIAQLPSLASLLLQFRDYEALDFEHVLDQPRSSLVCAYVVRKALIRKHYLSNTISTWLVKHPESPIKRYFKAAVNFELDYAEFLDEALSDAWDLNESMMRNETLEDDNKEKEWWILKPGMSDGGNGIRLFSNLQQLRSIFEEWEADEEGSGGEQEEQQVEEQEKGKNHSPSSGNMASISVFHGGTMTSQLRHFIAQPYIDPPLLLPSRGSRKFHIRVYCLAVGALKVYVYREMLALFAAKAYQSPSHLEVDLACHLTNTCFQDDASRKESVARFWDLEDAAHGPDWKKKVFEQICEATAEVFEAAAREQMVHFQTLPNAFEVFGIDFLVDSSFRIWLLEINAYPDFKQTGQHLQDAVIGGLFRQVMKVAVRPFFNKAAEENDSQGSNEMLLVKNMDMGRR